MRPSSARLLPVRSALVGLLLGAACSQPAPPGPTELRPASARITDEAIAADMEVFRRWQERVDGLASQTPSTDIERRYYVARANAFLAFAREEYWANDRGPVVDSSLAEAVKLINALAAGETGSLEAPLTPIAGTRAVRDDLWADVKRFKAHPRFHLAPEEVARLEVELLRAGHDRADGAACSAEPHAEQAAKLHLYVDSVLKTPPPEPEVPLPPVVIPDRDGDGVPDEFDCCPNTPSGKVVDNRGCPDPEMQTQTVLEGVEFDTDKFRLRPASRRILDSFAVELQRRPGVPVEISGHTDSVADDAYNARLSANRARAVRQYLVDRGIAPERLTAVGYGESRPRDTNGTSQGRQRNRRVELLWKLPVQLDLLPACVAPTVRPDGREPEPDVVRAAFIDDVLFPVSSIAILEPARRRLDAILRDVRSLDGFILVLEGHADEAGDPESNLALSLARAHKVRAYLVERGLPADRVIVMGFGSTRPRSDGRTEQGRQRNRRVELWLRPAGDLP